MNFQVEQDLYLFPTPAGTFYSVTSLNDDPARSFIVTLLESSTTPKINIEQLTAITGIKNKEDVLQLLHDMQEMGWLQGCVMPQRVRTGSMEYLLPDLLAPLSSERKALLADQNGFYISYSGFNADAAEQISALGADLASFHERHAHVLRNQLNLESDAWAVVDAAGNSQVGFWALYIGGKRFLLAIAGMPKFNQPVFTEMIWVLCHRYGKRGKR